MSVTVKFLYRFLPSGKYNRIMTSLETYANWSKEDLISRILHLEEKPAPAQHTKEFNFEAHPTRKIALRFAYAGSQYGGLAFQQGVTPLPTVEGVLFDAFAQTRLIDPVKGFEGCGWEKCGRTDRGVSGAGQVISLWVRSALGEVKKEPLLQLEDDEDDLGMGPSTPPAVVTHKELRYVSMLNRVLPPTIRVLAWSPVAPDFSARFGCKHRHYKYFFHGRGLDLSLMQDAADRLVGEHDFRNLCKMDASKQISNFNRRILHAKISPLQNGLYVFDLMGTAFLYNQVRHIVAILFLIGSGVEPPELVSALLNVDADNPKPPFKDGEAPPLVVDRKPEYPMADGLPLVLWDCAYDEKDVQWQVDEDWSGLVRQMRAIHERSSIHTVLDACFLEAASEFHDEGTPRSQFSLPLGGGVYTRSGKYIKVLDRKRAERVEDVNERWRVKSRDRLSGQSVGV